MESQNILIENNISKIEGELSKDSLDISEAYKNNDSIIKTENTPKEWKKYFIKINNIGNRYDSERSEEI